MDQDTSIHICSYLCTLESDKNETDYITALKQQMGIQTVHNKKLPTEHYIHISVSEKSAVNGKERNAPGSNCIKLSRKNIITHASMLGQTLDCIK